MSDWRYTIQRKALRYLKRLRREDQDRIVQALDDLVADPTSVDLKPLKGRSGLRLRVGNYRILMVADRKEKLFTVTEVGPRGDVYK